MRGYILRGVVLPSFFVSLSFGYDWSTNPGDGSEGNPYQISEPNQLIAIGANPDLLDKAFILTHDIDLSGYTFVEAVIAPELDDSTPIFDGTPFYGDFDGRNYVISNMTINDNGISSQYIGLFGKIVRCSIRNIILKNVSVTVGDVSWGVAGLCGYNDMGGIGGCYVSGNVTGGVSSHSLGGLCGGLYGSIWKCSAECNITGGDKSAMLGGLCGCLDYFSGIHSCYANSNVTGGAKSYYTGGFCGFMDMSSIYHCYAYGTVTSGSSSSFIGGFCGGKEEWNSITSCYFLDVSGPDNGIGIPLDDPNMMIQSNFAGWDFVGEDINGTEDIWTICEGTNYPRFVWQVPKGDFICPDGVGVEDVDAFGGCWLANVNLDTELEDDEDAVVSLPELARVGQYWLAVGCGDCGGMDLTGDGEVTMEDLSAVVEDWLRVVYPECGMADLNGDDFVDLADWAVFAAGWTGPEAR